MSILLDTHPFVWFLVDHKRIPGSLITILTDPARVVYVSAVAVWEATIKTGLGKLSLPLDDLEATIAATGFTNWNAYRATISLCLSFNSTSLAISPCLS